MICLPTPIETPDLDDIREAMQEAGGYGADTRTGLAGFWPGRHRGPKLLDFSGRANTGTWSGTGAHWASDGERQGVVPTFNGTDDYVSAPDNGSMLGAGGHTVSVWHYPTAQASLRQVFGKSSTSGWHIQLHIGNGADIRYRYTVRSTTIQSTDLPQNQWYHIVGTYTVSGTITLWINGVQKSQTSSGVPVDSGSVFLGGLAADSYSTGRLDDARFYTRALSAAEIRYLYDCGRVAPLSDLVEPVGWETVGVTAAAIPEWRASYLHAHIAGDTQQHVYQAGDRLKHAHLAGDVLQFVSNEGGLG